MNCKRCGCAIARGDHCAFCVGVLQREALAEEQETAAERQGIACPDCGCTWWRVYYTRQRRNRIIRQRECQHCGRRVMTTERLW
jgi:hypothetical protein